MVWFQNQAKASVLFIMRETSCIFLSSRGKEKFVYEQDYEGKRVLNKYINRNLSIYYSSTMEKKNPSFKKSKNDKVIDMSKQSDFLFNKTPILASALQRLKKQAPANQSKQKNYHKNDIDLEHL